MKLSVYYNTLKFVWNWTKVSYNLFLICLIIIFELDCMWISNLFFKDDFFNPHNAMTVLSRLRFAC